MRKFVILGHTGLIGHALEVALRQEGQTDVLGFSSKTLDLRRADDLPALARHLDATTTLLVAAGITREHGDDLEALLDNIRIAGHVGDLLESRRPAKCVYLSSDAVYPMQTDPVTEETPIAPEGTLYAIAKYTAESVLRRSARAKGIPLLVLRPTGVFGPGDTHNSYGPNAFVRGIVEHRAIRLFGDGEERRDHLYIDDLVRIVLELLVKDALGVYNVATGTSRSFHDVAEALRRVVPFEFAVTHLPRKGAITHRTFDVSRLVRVLPDFVFTDFDQALRQTFSSAHVALAKH